MKDPIKLLEGDATDAERVLLRAALAEEPPEDGARRLAALLGVSAALSATATAHASAATSGSASSSAAASGGVSASASKLALGWPWIATGLLVIAGGAWVLRGARGGDDDAGGAAHRRVPSAALQAAPVSTSAPLGATTTTAPAAQEPVAAKAAQATVAAAKSIAREVVQLDAARTQLGRGEARAALATLDDYERDHHGGVLREEAAVLRIEALAGSNQRDAARELAERFVRAHPKSPHAERVRALGGTRPDAR